MKLQGTGHFAYDQLNFKHAKYKYNDINYFGLNSNRDVLMEITDFVAKTQPNLKQKLEDLASYIKVL